MVSQRRRQRANIKKTFFEKLMNIQYLNFPPYPNRWMVWLIQQGLAWRPRCVKTCCQEDDHTIPYHTIPYHTIPYHTIPYHTIPYHTIPFCTSTPPYYLEAKPRRRCKTEVVVSSLRGPRTIQARERLPDQKSVPYFCSDTLSVKCFLVCMVLFVTLLDRVDDTHGVNLSPRGQTPFTLC